MTECYGKKIVLNGELLPADHFDNSLVYDGDSIYEVIKMIKGKPVFFHDHMERLTESLRLQSKRQITDEKSLRNDILRLTRADRMKLTNLKIVFNYKNDSENSLVYFIEPIYPTEDQYKNGVKGIFYFAERENPSSKVINHKLRSSIYHKLILEGGYEAVLVNENIEITEGSRSNIFFVKDNKLVTAPDEYVLNGITRKHVMEICADNNIPVDLKCVKADEIDNYDSVFMTGTSPVVLPFCCINDKYFRVDMPLLVQLRKLYLAKAEESVRDFRL